MMKIGVCLTVCVYSVMSIEMTKFSNFFGRVQLRDGYAFLAATGYQTQHACATLCVDDNGCSLSEYNSVSKYCTLFFWMDVKMLIVPNNKTDYMNTVIMVKPGNKQLYLKSSTRYYYYDVSESQGLCQRVGGRLATLAEITSASLSGWEVCGCGWLDDGQPTAVVSVLTPQCGSHLHVCNHMTPPLYDVHCTVF